MPAISFQEEWIDKLLRGDKQQTTRAQTDRIKVGDMCTIYNQQRRQITDKPLRMLTVSGIEAMQNRGYQFVPKFLNSHYYAHFLGKVEIAEVSEMRICDNSARSAWAKADGFDNFTCADTWFTGKYGDDWDLRTWTVIRWDGWLERYFEAEN